MEKQTEIQKEKKMRRNAVIGETYTHKNTPPTPPPKKKNQKEMNKRKKENFKSLAY